MRGGAEDPDATDGVLDDGEYLQPRSGQGDRFEEVAGQQGASAWERKKSAHVLELHSSAGSIPASLLGIV